MARRRFDRISRDMAVEQSLDAAIEVNEVIEGRSDHSPALAKLIELLVGTQGGAAQSRRELLRDSQFASLYHRAATSSGRQYHTIGDMDDTLQLLFNVNSLGLSSFSQEDLEFIKDFCVGLNRELTSESFDRAPVPPLARSRYNSRMASHAH